MTRCVGAGFGREGTLSQKHSRVIANHVASLILKTSKNKDELLVTHTQSLYVPDIKWKMRDTGECIEK